MPPLATQQQFAERVTKITQLKVNHNDSLCRIEALFQALQQRAFDGELFTDHEARHALHDED